MKRYRWFLGVGVALVFSPLLAQSGSDPKASSNSSSWSKAGEQIKEAAGTLGSATTETVTQGWEATKQQSSQIWEATKTHTQQGWQATKDFTTHGWEATQSYTQEKWDAAKGAVQGTAGQTQAPHKSTKQPASPTSPAPIQSSRHEAQIPDTQPSGSSQPAPRDPGN